MVPTWGRLALSDSRPFGETTAGGGAGSANLEPAVSLSDRSIALLADGEGSSCHCNDNSQAGNGMGYSGPYLPEDILCHIHALMPLQDAARAACVSHAFLYSWRHCPNITISKAELGLDENAQRKDKKHGIARYFTSTVDHIMRNHSGVGLKVVKIEFGYSKDANPFRYLSSWLEASFTPALEELTLLLPSNEPSYKFPCSLLCSGSGSSIQKLVLSSCAFSPMVGLSSLRNLKSVHLRQVRLTEDKLGDLLSCSLALERLHLSYCNEIICLKIPCQLQQLSYLEVFECCRLRVMEIKAPNISGFHFSGRHVELSLGEPLQEKELEEGTSCNICYTSAKLASIMPNHKTLTVSSTCQIFNTPMASSKFFHLKHLSISLLGEILSHAYDYRSLASFLVAAPLLETFILGASQFRMLEQLRMENGSVIGEDTSHVRLMPEQRHRSLKSMKITGFCSSKSLVELTCHILENATALECLTLDTTCRLPRCSVNKLGRCFTIEMDGIIEAQRALMVVRQYIEGKVPPTVKLSVLEPCAMCHALRL